MASATKFSEIPDASITHNADGTNSPNVFSTSSGSGATADQVQGTAATDSPAVGNPVRVGGTDTSGRIRTIHTDSAGNVIAVGPTADNAVVSTNPILVAGADGTALTQTLLTDASGRLNIVGAAADGAAVSGNPILVGGCDGTNTQTLLTDNTGRLLPTTRISDFSNVNFAWVGVPGDADTASNSVLFVNAQGAVYNGVTNERLRTPNKGKYIQLASSAAEQNIWTPAAGKKFRLMGFILTTDVDCNLTFRDNPTGALIFLASAKALVPTITPPNLINGFLSGNINRILTIQASAAATIFGTVFGCEE